MLKKRIRQGLTYVAFVAGIVGLYQAQKNGARMSSLPNTLQRQFRFLILGLLGFVNRAIGRVQGSM